MAKKILASILALCMVLSTMGTFVFADSTNVVAKIGNTEYATLEAALTDASNGDTIELQWNEGDAPIDMNGAIYGKTVTIKGTATVDWSKGYLFVGRGGEGNGTVIFENANLTSASNSSSYGIHVSGREKETTNKYDGTLVINDSTIELDYLINRGTINVDNSTFTVKNGFGIAGRPASETESGKAATATINITNNSYVKVLNHNGMGIGVASSNPEGNGILNLTDSTFECASFNVDSDLGKFNVYGESTLKIDALSGNEIKFLDGAIIKDSTVGGGVFVAGNVTFRGDNTFNMLYDYGTLKDYYGTTANMEWTVEDGASVTLLDKARYGLGYGDNVTVNGNITNALTARNTLTEDDASLFMHGLVGQESSGWNQQSYLNVNNAYVIIGSNNSFGNKPGNYGGTYTYNINNSVVDASRITFYEAKSTSAFNITGSDVKMGTFMTRDADSVFTLTDSKVVSTATSNGTDEGNYNAGTLKLVNSDLTYSTSVENTGVLTVDTNSSLTAPSITGTGKIEIDVSNYDGYADLSNIINADLTGFTGEVKAVGGNGAEVKFENGKLVIEANPTGGPITGYTSETSIWGETKANAKVSYVIKVYSGDTFMGQSALNPNKGLIDGNVNVTWNIQLDAASNTDDNWIMSWAIAPSMDCQPTHVALEVDGVEVSRSAIQLNGPDSINKIHAAITDENGKILSYATSLQNAFDKVKDGETIELLRDVVLTESVVLDTDGAVVIDGNGFSIKQAKDYNDTQNGLFMLGNTKWSDNETATHNYTIKNVIFDGIEGWSAIRAQGVTLTVDDCRFVNGNYTDGQSMMRFDYTEATVKYTTVKNNTALMAITHNFNGDNSNTKLLVEECVIEGNTFNKTAGIYYVCGGGCTITKSEFVGNTVNAANNCAIVYLGFQEDCVVTGNLFKDNNVYDSSTSKRVAGAIFFGYEANISGNVFINNTATNAAGDQLGQHICTSTYYDCEIDLDGNYFDGEEPVEGKHFFIQHKTGDGTFNLENYYGEYTLDADGNVVLSDAKPVNAKSVSVNFVLNTEKSNADESYLVYDIVINSRDGHVINRLNTADLTFEISSSKVAYEITPADKITLTTDADYAHRYMFNFKGKDDVKDTDTSLKIGEVKLTGYDTFTFGVKNVDTNLVTATTVDDNIVDEFKGTGLVVSDIINTTITVPKKTLTVNVTFPNVVVDKASTYQNMSVTISGGDLAADIVKPLGSGTNANASYTVTEDLTLNTAYTVTVKGDGYRTARYTVTMTGDKTLNFWNNVMDNKMEVEEGKASSAVFKNFLAGDIVADNNINIYDLSAVVSYFTQDATKDAKYIKYDLNRDGVIDSKDVAYVLVSWGE